VPSHESQPPGTGSLIEVVGLSKTYRDGGIETTVLASIDLTIERGETIGLLGVSGSGKSTLISLLAGLMRPDAGEIWFDGRDMTRLDDTARAGLRASRLGVVLQSSNLVPFLTAKENVELAVALAGGDNASHRAAAALADVGLSNRLDQLPRRMSGGEAQRVAVAAALVNEPDLLLADEVTGELDSTTAHHVMDVIWDAWRQRGLSVLYATHSRDLAGRASRRLRLADGHVHPG
jgi:putative ABC transport system ATP-binding protein